MKDTFHYEGDLLLENKKYTSVNILFLLFLLFFNIFCPLPWIEAAPTGFSLQQGEALPPTQTEEGTYLIQSADHAVIHWESFSIQEKEHIQFAQKDRYSSVLNCVMGKEESHLLGKLTSNGCVYLVNPHGIVIGSEALIETAGVIASTLDLVEDNLSTKHFSGQSSKGILHQGKIRCSVGDVFLIGRHIENQGEIYAPQGRQALLSSCDVVIAPEGAPQIWIHPEEKIDQEELQENPYALAIRHTGKIEAKESYLVAEKGICEVQGIIEAPGGKVQVLGEVVHLLDTTSIDVSHEKGGGEILIGGDYQGKNPKVKNATFTWMGEKAELKADALKKGEGGKIIVWGNRANLAYGQISACGGEEGGDGGFVEISAPLLDFHAKVKALAPQGKTGTLLLDPHDVVIGSSATTDSFSACGPPSSYHFVTGTATTQILHTDLQTQLASCSVVIDTVGTAGSGSENGSIQVTSPVSWSTANSLTLRANSFINITASLTSSSATPSPPATYAIELIAEGNSAGGNSGIRIAGAGVAVSANGGDIFLFGKTDTTSTPSAGVFITGGGVVNTTSGDIYITGENQADRGVILNTSGNVVASTSGDIYLSGITTSTTSIKEGFEWGTSWTAQTTGTIYFGAEIVNPYTSYTIYGCKGSVGMRCGASFSTGGDVVFENCVGGQNSNSGAGVSIEASFSAAGNITTGTAITTESGDSGSPSVGFSASADITALSIDITASSNGLGANSHGISLMGGSECTMSATGGSINLQGTGSPIGADSHGIELSGLATTDRIANNAGPITLEGTATTGSGVYIATLGVGAIVSDTQNITIKGTSTNSYGVFVTSIWESGTSGTVAFSNCSGGGDKDGVFFGTAFTGSGEVTFSSCLGGTGGGDGIHIGAAFTTPGNIVATSNIQGRGDGGIGFSSNQNISVTGASNTISITASATGTTGTCHGISLTGGSLSTVGGAISLVGTSGASTTASYGVHLSGADPQIIYSTTGDISLTGTSQGLAEVSHGIFLNTTWSAATSGSLSLTATAGSGIGSFPIGLGATLNSGGTISFNDAVILLTTGSVTSSGNMTFTSTIDGAHPLTVVAGSGQIAFSDTVGSSISLGALDVSTGSSLSVGGDITASSILISIPAILTAADITFDTSNSNGFIHFANTLNGTASGSQALTLLAGAGQVTFSGAVGNSVRLGALSYTTTYTTGATFTSNVTASSFTATDGTKTTLTGSSIINTLTNIYLGGTVDGAYDLTLRSETGSLTLKQAIGGTATLGAFSIASGSLASIEENITASSISVAVPTQISKVSTSFNTSSGNGSLSISDSLNGTSSYTQTLVLLSGTGNISVTGAIGGSTPLKDLQVGSFSAPYTTNSTVAEVTAASIIATNSGTLSLLGDIYLTGDFSESQATQVNVFSSITAEDITFNDPIMLSSQGIFFTSEGGIYLGSTVDGSYPLTLNAGWVSFHDNVGVSQALTSLNVITSGDIFLQDMQVVGSGPMNYFGKVTLTGNTQCTNNGTSGIEFQEIEGNYSLTLTANSSSITVSGDVDLSGTGGSSGGSLTATAGSGITFTKQILSKGNGSGNGGSVSLASSGGSISVHNIHTSGGATAGNGGNITLEPAGTYAEGSPAYPRGIIILNEDLSLEAEGNLVAKGGEGGTGGDILLSAHRTDACKVATITSGSSNDISLTGNSFTMGPFEAMTCLGSITLSCPTLTLGDIVALEDLMILGVQVNLRTRDSISILNSQGLFKSFPTLHFLSGGIYIQSGFLIPSDGKLNAQSLDVSPSIFREKLLFEEYVLNFDGVKWYFLFLEQGIRGYLIYQLLIADAELSDLLPIEKTLPPKPFLLGKVGYK